MSVSPYCGSHLTVGITWLGGLTRLVVYVWLTLLGAFMSVSPDCGYHLTVDLTWLGGGVLTRLVVYVSPDWGSQLPGTCFLCVCLCVALQSSSGFPVEKQGSCIYSKYMIKYNHMSFNRMYNMIPENISWQLFTNFPMSIWRQFKITYWVYLEFLSPV